MTQTYPKFPLVVVTWADAFVISRGWEELEETVHTPAICYTGGFLQPLDNNDVRVWLTVSAPEEGQPDQANTYMTIPKAWIRDITYLPWPKKTRAKRTKRETNEQTT